MSEPLSPEEVEERRKRFFRWFRHRHANAAALGSVPPPTVGSSPTSFVPEQYLMIGAQLDALANHWNAAANQRKIQSHQERFQAFVEQHANSTGIFNKVSAPLLRAEVHRKLPRLTHVLDAVIGVHPDEDFRARDWREDPDYAQLANDAKLADRALQKLVQRHRFGVLIYLEVRNQWVHEMFESSRVARPYRSTEGIWYQNLTTYISPEKSRRSHPITLPVLRLLDFLKEAIDSFERECIDKGIDPIPDSDD
jgi:hypothetical protein